MTRAKTMTPAERRAKLETHEKTQSNGPGVTRKIVEAGGWGLARRFSKQIPVVGSVFAIGLVGYDIKKKGFWRGIVNSGIDAIPIVGTGKNVIEIFTGDFLPDKDPAGDQPENENNEEIPD